MAYCQVKYTLSFRWCQTLLWYQKLGANDYTFFAPLDKGEWLEDVERGGCSPALFWAYVVPSQRSCCVKAAPPIIVGV